MGGFSVDLVKEGTRAIITLAGELDMSTVEKLSELATATLLDPDTHQLVVDLDQVTFLDSTSLATLIDLQALAESEGKRFGLGSLSPRVTRVFELTGMTHYFATSPKENDPPSQRRRRTAARRGPAGCGSDTYPGASIQ